MQILAGTCTSTAVTHDGRALVKAINTGWSPMQAAFMFSDILTLWGMDDVGAAHSDQYVLSMSFDASDVPPGLLKNGQTGLLSQNATGNGWVSAVAGYQPQFVLGAFNPALHNKLGTYGIDVKTGTAWAVVNHDGVFAVGKLSGLVLNDFEEDIGKTR